MNTQIFVSPNGIFTNETDETACYYCGTVELPLVRIDDVLTCFDCCEGD